MRRTFEKLQICVPEFRRAFQVSCGADRFQGEASNSSRPS